MDSLDTLKARLAEQNARYTAWIKEVNQQSGLDPFPVFQEVATLSSEGGEGTTFPGSMQEFLSGFKCRTQRPKRKKR